MNNLGVSGKMYQVKQGLDYVIRNYKKIPYLSLAFLTPLTSPFGPSNAIAQEALQAFRNPQAGIERVVEPNYESDSLQQRKRNLKRTVDFTVTDILNNGYLDGAVVTAIDMRGNMLPRVSVNNGSAQLELDKGKIYRLEISHASYQPRTIEKFKITKNINLNVGLIPLTYPIDFLRETGMNNPDAEIQDGTVKPDRKIRPKYRINLGYYIGFIDDTLSIIPGNAFKPEQIAFIEKIINSELKEITQDCFDDNNNFVIEKATSLPVLDKNGIITVPDGVIDVIASYWILGGVHGETIRKQLIVSGGIEIHPDLDVNGQGAQDVFKEELLQVTAGMRNDSDIGDSILRRNEIPGSRPSSGYTQQDYDTQTILCVSPEGLMYPANTLKMINGNTQF